MKKASRIMARIYTAISKFYTFHNQLSDPKTMRFLIKFIITSTLLLTLHGSLLLSSAFGYGKNKVVYEPSKWKILKSAHIDLYYPEEMVETAKKASLMAEEAVVLLSNKLRHELSGVIPVVIYPSMRDFQGTNIIPSMIGEGTGGFTEALKKRVAIPFSGSFVQLRHVLTHELVHAFQFDILLGDSMGSGIAAQFMRMPLWVMEGMAEYYSLGWDPSVDMAVRDAIVNEALPTLDDLNYMRVPTFYSLYKFGQAIFYFIAKEYGEGKIPEILKDIRDTRADMDLTIRENLKISWEEFDKKFRRWLRKRYWPLVVDKKYFDEYGKLETDHLKKWATFNFKPAVSPDGKKVAYFTNEDFYTNIVVADIPDKESDNTIKAKSIIVDGNRSDDFEELRILSNRISWSLDGKRLLFASKSNGRDSLLWVDSKSGDIIRKYQPPLRFLGYPGINRDNSHAVFVGMRKDHLELFILDLDTGFLESLVNDLFDKKDPVFSRDGKEIFFVSNRNKLNNVESRNYGLFKVNLKSKKVIPITLEDNELDISSPEISPDGKLLTFSGRRDGITNIYTANIVDSKIGSPLIQQTNLLGGGFYPRFYPDSKRIAYNSYYIYGFDIVSFETSDKEKNIKKDSLSYIDPVAYPLTGSSLTDAKVSDYNLRIQPELLGFNLAYSSFGFIGILQTSFSDMLGDRRLFVSVDYFGRERNSNFQLTYMNLKSRLDLIAGVYRKKNFINIITLTDLNEIWNPSYYGTESLYNYGFFVGASYPFSKFLRWENRFSSSRYEQNFSDWWPRVDISANLNQLTSILVFDNVLWGMTYPVDGLRGEITVERALNISGNDFEFYRVEFDIRRYFLVFRRYSFAFRFYMGSIFDQDVNIFQYEIGGFNTIRGHPYRSYKGPNSFLFNAEFRFPFVDIIKFAWPFPFSLGGLAGLWFFDMGGAWEDYFQFVDEDGRLNTPKASYGVGFRMVLLPFLIFRLDFATPWDLKTSKPISKWQGEFSIGVDY